MHKNIAKTELICYNLIMQSIYVEAKKFLCDYNVLSNMKDSFTVHTHNLYELIFFVRGDANHVVEDRKYKLSKNDLVLVPPRQYHHIEVCSNGEYERYNILFDPEMLEIDKIEGFDKLNDVINLSTNKIAQEIFAKFNFYYSKLSESAFIEVAFSLLKELFYNISVFKTESKKECHLTPLLSSALSFINEHLFTIKSIDEVVNHLYITPSYLFKLFKKELKTSPKKYINDKRITYAQNLILLGERPTDIALKCGFEDYTSFYRQYKKVFNISPSQENLR